MSRVFRWRTMSWAAMIGGGGTAIVIGLPIASLLPTAPDPKAGVSISHPVTVAVPVTFEIVPAPVIETHPKFFFGTGDGSAGYYAERPSELGAPGS
ncbi:MAG: hypothetical protein ACLQNV_09530 [Steroidobacteraceae bacterium]